MLDGIYGDCVAGEKIEDEDDDEDEDDSMNRRLHGLAGSCLTWTTQ